MSHHLRHSAVCAGEMSGSRYGASVGLSVYGAVVSLSPSSAAADCGRTRREYKCMEG